MSLFKEKINSLYYIADGKASYLTSIVSYQTNEAISFSIIMLNVYTFGKGIYVTKAYIQAPTLKVFRNTFKVYFER